MKNPTLQLIPPSILLLAMLIFQNCQPVPADNHPSRQQQVEKTAKDFFATFAQRSDWNKFCSFYREDLVFDDIMLQLHLDSLWQFKRFYKWDEEGNHFKKLTPDQEHLSIETLVANDSVAVGRGRVNPFYYYGKLIDADWGMEFTIWLYFDENFKIIKQVDWMEYDSGVLENVIKHVKENGLDKTPDWLDLSTN